ncbi:MAG: rhodanese-like domain-containing protein [Rhizobiaceae bacterium]|nr:rhodanese-like domain-containing protein [Rhizobiaceae bacterium]
MSLISIAWPAHADTPLMSAPQAYEKLSKGDLIVLDIRSREEWQDSGIAQGALPISMHEKDFLERFQSVLLEYEPEKIAMICATGGRSAEVTYFLEQNGLTGVADISEGMFGNRNGPGWLKHGLPVVSASEALANYEKLQSTWNQ